MSIEAMKLALEALEIVTREMLTLRDELAERGGRPKANVVHQRLWDSSFKVYTDTADTTAESLRQAIAEAEQAQPVAWADDCRIELVNAIHSLSSDFENALYAFRGDTEARKSAEGSIAHARGVAVKWNRNGRTTPPQTVKVWDSVGYDALCQQLEQWKARALKAEQATPPQRKPLTDEQLDKAGMKLAECMDYPWEYMPEEGKRNMRDHAKAIIEAAHGIKENT